MTETVEGQIKQAISDAIKSDEVGGAISQRVKESLDKALGGSSISGIVEGIVQGALKGALKADFDPYRTTIHFLAGLIAFSLTLIVGIVTALPERRIDFCSPTYMMLGGVLISISITALIATMCMGIAQYLKNAYRSKQNNNENPAIPNGGRFIALKLAPVIPGIVATIFCALAGWAMFKNDDPTPPLRKIVPCECLKINPTPGSTALAAPA